MRPPTQAARPGLVEDELEVAEPNRAARGMAGHGIAVAERPAPARPKPVMISSAMNRTP